MEKASNWIVLSLIGIIGLFLIFEVPYLFPPQVMTLSASYDYGFNNTIGIIVLGIVSLLFVGAGFLSVKDDKYMHIGIHSSAETPLSFSAVVITSGLSIVLVFILFLISGDFGFGESQQFILAMERVSIGQQLYKDFDFYYGPLLVYIPYAIYKISYLFEGSFKGAYFICLAFLQIAGLFELRYILNAIPIQEDIRKKTFYAIALFTLPFHSGINLILFRFITPAAGMILLKKIGEMNVFIKSITILALSSAVFGISIEYGVIFTVALTIYYLGLSIVKKCPVDLFYSALVLTVAFLFLFFFPGLFNTVKLYLLGGWRWPFVPSLPLLLFFISVFLLSFTIGNHLKNISENYFFLSLCLLALGTLPAALGRCDPGHVFLNGLMVLILSFSFLSYITKPKLTRLFGLMLVLSFGVPLMFGTIYMCSGIYSRNAFIKLDLVINQKAVDKFTYYGAKLFGKDENVIKSKIQAYRKSKKMNLENQFSSITKVIAPYNLPDNLSNFLRLTNRIDSLYFKDYNILASEIEVERALQDMKKFRNDFLVIPIGWEKMDKPDSQIGLINILFLTKYTKDQKRNSRLLLTPIIKYINENYSFHSQVDNQFIIMQPLSSTNDKWNKL